MNMKTLFRGAGFLCIAAGLSTLPSSALAQSKVGTSSAQFLGISVGPKAMGMGGAYVASNSDATLLFWNPGAFAQTNKTQVVFSHTDWLVGTKFRWVGLMLKVGDEDAVGLSLTQLDYGEEEVTTVASPAGTGERWSANDIAIALSYSRRLTDRFSLGGSFKYIGQSIWNESATTFAIDLGLLFVTDFNDLRLGVAMSNFGGDLKLDGEDLFKRVDIDPGNPGGNKTLVGGLKTDGWPLPLVFRVGLAMDVLRASDFNVTIAADAIRPSDNVETVNVGGEFGWNNMVFLRGGYKSLFGQDSEEGLALGAGLKYAAEGLGSIEVNYAYTEFGLFGNLNTIAVAIGF